MKITLTKKCCIGMMVLPALFSCATLDHETYADNNEQPKKAIATPKPTAIDYGKLIKITSTADTLFDFDSATLKPSSVQSLENFTRELRSIQNDLLIIGYTDRIGSKNYNKKLSLRRAETVKIYLISKGIDPNSLFTDGRGENNPLTGNTCGENMEIESLIDCLSPDRRVEVKVKSIQ